MSLLVLRELFLRDNRGLNISTGIYITLLGEHRRTPDQSLKAKLQATRKGPQTIQQQQEHREGESYWVGMTELPLKSSSKARRTLLEKIFLKVESVNIEMRRRSTNSEKLICFKCERSWKTQMTKHLVSENMVNVII